MLLPKREKEEKHPLDIGLQYAVKGITYTLLNERNFRIHLYIGCGTLLSALFLGLSLVEFAILILVIGIVLLMEMLNTVIEVSIDLVSPQYHQLAEIAKDVAAGAVLLSVLLAIIIAFFLLLPHLVRLILLAYGHA